MTALGDYVRIAEVALTRRYDDVASLAEGRSGIVFSATTREAEPRSVAIKIAYPIERESDLPASVVRFRREAELGALLRHPHILRIDPLQGFDGLELYEMDMAGSYRLDHVVLGEHPPTFERVLAIMEQVAAAVDHAHEQGIVHGALRPTCVLLDQNGGVILKGFLLREGEAPPHPALAPGAVGDPAYMPPEQWHLPRVDRRVDVYSAGVLAYELCTGERRVSYEVPGVPEIRPMELAPNRALREGIPLHASAAIRRATSKDPRVRFASVGEFVKALREAETALGHSLPTLVPQVKKARGSRALLAVLVLVAVALGLTIPFDSQQTVVHWGRSLLSFRMGDIDPFPKSTGSTSGGSSSGSSRSSGSTSREPSQRSDPTTRESSTSREESSNRESTRREESGRISTSTASDAPPVSVSPSRPSTARADGSSGASSAASNADQSTATNGAIRISIDQGRALVLVDGLPRGFAPVTVSASPGVHRISVRGTLTYDPTEMRLQVTRGDTALAEFYATNAPADTLAEARTRFGVSAIAPTPWSAR